MMHNNNSLVSLKSFFDMECIRNNGGLNRVSSFSMLVVAVYEDGGADGANGTNVTRR